MSDLLYLSRQDIRALNIGMAEVVEAVEQAFRLKGSGRAVMPPKSTMTAPGGAFAQVMPAWLEPGGGGATREAALGAKLVTIFPDNAARGLAVTNALISLADGETGEPAVVMDGGLVTALRTGAGAGVAARYLAAPDTARVGVIGCGAQARASARALAVVLSELREIRCYDVVAAAATAFAEDVRSALREEGVGAAVDITVCDAPAAVCAGAGVVVSAITMAEGVAPPLGPGLLEPGALAVAIDYDAAWSPAAMAECERFITDDVGQTLATRAHGLRLQDIPETIDGDLGEVVAGLAPGRTSPGQRVFCLNLGIAVTDVVCARLICARAAAAGVGTRLPL